MKRTLFTGLIVILVLSACSANRQKLSPQANLNLKSANVYYADRENDASLKKALSLYEKVLQDNPNHVLALKRSADLDYFFALRIEPKKDDSSGKLEYINLDKAQEADSLYKITYTKYDAILKVMTAFKKLNDNERSIKRDSGKKKESSWVKILKIAQIQMENKLYDDAIPQLEYLMQLNPTKEEPIRMLVILYQAKNDTAKFEYYLNKILTIKPNDLEMLRMLGVHYFNAKDYAKSVTYFEKIMALNLADTDNLTNLTNAYYEMGNYEAANTVNLKLLKIDPENLTALYNAKDIAKKLSNVNDEVTYMKQIVNVAPTAENLAAYVRLMFVNKMTEELMEYAERWYDMDKTNKEAVQYCYQVAMQNNRKDLMQKYMSIYNTLNK